MILDVDALTLDVGGVFVVPDHGRLSAALTQAGVAHDPEAFWDGHYHAMHGVDSAQSPPETFDAYVPAFCHMIGLADDDVDRAIAAISPLFGPSGLWVQPIPGSIDGMAALHAAGVPMAIVSNADGTVHQILEQGGVCQVGDGPCTPVVTIVDSGALGIAKPDPATFAPAIDALGLEPERIAHVGDSVHYDVEGARAAGMIGVHFDPRRLCRSDDHPHITSLDELLG